MIPDHLVLKILRNHKTVAGCLSDIIDISRKLGDTEITGITLPINNKKIAFEGSPEKLVTEKKLLAETCIMVSFENKSFVMVDEHSKETWVLEYYVYIKNKSGKTPTQAFSILKEISTGFLNSGNLEFCHVRRDNGGADCMPIVPIVSTDLHLVVTNKIQVDQYYENLEQFIKSPFDSVTKSGSMYLITLSENDFENDLFLRNEIPVNWELARSSRPETTEYYLPDILENEEDIFRSGKQVLKQVGYIAAEKTLEFSCYLDKNEHIAGWEIYDLLRIREKGKLPSGETINDVRVVFYEKEMALREKRPLLDIGIRVYYQSDNIIEITE